MKILKYKKGKKNEYKILTDDGEYVLYDDIIVKHELLLKKEINKKEWDNIIKENNLLKAYYEGLKAIGVKLRTAKELRSLLSRKNYVVKEIDYAIKRLEEEGYLNHQVYIEAYIHDALTLKLVGERKICSELESLGFKTDEINKYLSKIDPNIYQEKIEKYILKKLKANKKSVSEFKRKIMLDLVNKGFNREDIEAFLNTLEIEENTQEIEKIINRLYNKYMNKYDLYTTKNKIRQYLYSKGYASIDIDEYIKRT